VGKLAPGEQDAPAALAAFQSNIRAQPHHNPLVAPARMWFTQLNAVLQPEISQHV